jgi:hypothetical protein
MMPGIAG